MTYARNIPEPLRDQIFSLIRQVLSAEPNDPPTIIDLGSSEARDKFRYYLYSTLHFEGIKSRIRVSVHGTTSLILHNITIPEPIVIQQQKSTGQRFFEDHLIERPDGTLLESDEEALNLIWNAVNAGTISKEQGEEAYSRWKKMME